VPYGFDFWDVVCNAEWKLLEYRKRSLNTAVRRNWTAVLGEITRHLNDNLSSIVFASEITPGTHKKASPGVSR